MDIYATESKSILLGTRDPNDLLKISINDENARLVHLALNSGAKVTLDLYEKAYKCENLDIFEFVQSFISIDFSNDIYSFLDRKDFVGLRKFISSRRSFSGCNISYVYNILNKYPNLLDNDLLIVVNDFITYCYRPSLPEYLLALEKNLLNVAKLIKVSSEFLYNDNFDDDDDDFDFDY